MDALYTAIRAACSDETWSVGVRLARDGAVRFESRTDDEIVARVRTLKTLAAPKVVLFLDDPEWVCDCGSRAEACEHVAAAAIAVKLGSAAGDGSEISAEPHPAHVAYRFWRRSGGLYFERGLARADEFHVLEIGLEAASAGRAGVPRFVATRADLEVDVVLGAARRGPVPAGLAGKLLAALARCSDVRLEDRAIRAGPQPVSPVVVVEDAGEGYRVRLADSPAIDERFANGIVRIGDELRPVREPHLTAREFEDYSRGRLFGPGDVAELVSRELPSLSGRLPVEVRTSRLPQAVVERPRVSLEVSTEGPSGEVLAALATLVYGDPARARVDGGRLLALSEPVPVRDEPEERRATERLARVLGLGVGVAARFEGTRPRRLRAGWSAGTARSAEAASRASLSPPHSCRGYGSVRKGSSTSSSSAGSTSPERIRAAARRRRRSSVRGGAARPACCSPKADGRRCRWSSWRSTGD